MQRLSCAVGPEPPPHHPCVLSIAAGHRHIRQSACGQYHTKIRRLWLQVYRKGDLYPFKGLIFEYSSSRPLRSGILSLPTGSFCVLMVQGQYLPLDFPFCHLIIPAPTPIYAGAVICYSTVTDFARFFGLSILHPRSLAT